MIMCKGSVKTLCFTVCVQWVQVYSVIGCDPMELLLSAWYCFVRDACKEMHSSDDILMRRPHIAEVIYYTRTLLTLFCYTDKYAIY